MTSFNIAPFELYDQEHEVAVRHNSNIGVGILFFYVSPKWMEFVAKESCFYGNSGILWIFLSNRVTMATFIRLLNKMSAKLMGMICYYALWMNKPALNDKPEAHGPHSLTWVNWYKSFLSF